MLIIDICMFGFDGVLFVWWVCDLGSVVLVVFISGYGELFDVDVLLFVIFLFKFFSCC